jgi:hypothetical protein
MRKHLYVMGLTKSSLRRRCGAEEESSAHVLCECEALASLRYTYLGSFSWTQTVNVCGRSGTSVEEASSYVLASDRGAKWASKGLEPNYYLHLSPFFMGI